jgi:hypothetical protein
MNAELEQAQVVARKQGVILVELALDQAVLLFDPEIVGADGDKPPVGDELVQFGI